VESIMSNVVCVCAADDLVEDVARVMGEKQLRRIPVIDPDGRLVGVLSLNDLALAAVDSVNGAALNSADVGRTLAAISRHRPNSGSAEPY
jgi:predicted transcriptional regulator